MEKLYELKEKLRRELDEIARKPEMSAGDLEAAHKLTDTIKNIDKICMLEEEGYSEDDGQSYGGSSYGRGSSYANRGQHWVRGHYSREGGGYDGGGQGGSSARRGGSRGGRGGRGGYSRDGGREEMMEHVRMAIETAPEEYKEDIKRFMREIENG